MTNVTVLINFRDKENPAVIHTPGSVLELADDRAVALATRGLVKLSNTETHVEEVTQTEKSVSVAEGDAVENTADTGEVEDTAKVEEVEISVEETPKPKGRGKRTLKQEEISE